MSTRYLGTTIVNGKGFTFSRLPIFKKFYWASNTILRAVNKPSEEVIMELIYACCSNGVSVATDARLRHCNKQRSQTLIRIQLQGDYQNSSGNHLVSYHWSNIHCLALDSSQPDCHSHWPQLSGREFLISCFSSLTTCQFLFNYDLYY